MIKRRARILSIFLCVIFSIANAFCFISTDKISDILKLAEKGDWVLCDIGGTLTKIHENRIGSNWWAHYKVKKLGALGIRKRLQLWTAIQKQSKMELIENDGSAVKVLEKLKEKGCNTIGFTARGIALADRTKEQLFPLGIEFAINDFSVEEKEFVFKYGILFVNPCDNKGELLKKFFSKASLHPKKIIFIDDSKTNLLEVGKACELAGIKYEGVLYTATYEEDGKVKTDPEIIMICDIQQYIFEAEKKLISEQEAKEVLKEFKSVSSKMQNFLDWLEKENKDNKG